MADYVNQRRRGWYFEIEVPEKLRPYYDGKKRIVQSLKTDSRSIAVIRAKPLAAKYKAEFEAYRTGASPLSADFMATVLEWRQDYQKAAADPELRMDYDDVLAEQAAKLTRVNPNHAAALPGLVRSEFILTTEHLDAFVNVQKQRVEVKTADMRRSDVLEFAKSFATTDKITQKAVKRWIVELEGRGVQHATIKRKLTALRTYWQFMQDAELLEREDNPFLNVLSGDRKKRAKTDSTGSWEPFTDAQVLNLLRAAESKRKPDHQLADLIRLGMWTGCRIEELCSLRVSDVYDGYIQIVEAKTRKGERDVPIHAELAPTLARLVRQSSDGYVLSGLDTENKYGSRSSAIGKRFGKLKIAEGFGPKHVFHSIRKTVVTILENAEVPEGIVADIVGHEKQTMTYGVYSGGTSLPRKAEALSKLRYAGWTGADAHPSIPRAA